MTQFDDSITKIEAVSATQLNQLHTFSFS